MDITLPQGEGMASGQYEYSSNAMATQITILPSNQHSAAMANTYSLHYAHKHAPLSKKQWPHQFKSFVFQTHGRNNNYS